MLQHSGREASLPEVLSLYNSHKRYGTRPTTKELIDLLGRLTSAYERLLVMIDALDECAESDEDALRFLSIVRFIGPNVRILCTSRCSTAFKAYFASEGSEEIEILAQDEDIKMFLDSEINQKPGLSKHLRADPDLGREIMDSITRECQGMYEISAIELIHAKTISTGSSLPSCTSSLSLPRLIGKRYDQHYALFLQL